MTTEYASGLAYSPDGSLLAASTGMGQQRVVLWRLDTGEQVRTLGGSGAVAFSPDGELLATSGNGVTQLWNPATGEHLRNLPIEVGFGFSPDGTIFAGTGEDQEVKLFDPATGNPLRTLTGVYASALAFSPDGHRILVVDPTQTVRVVALD
jgi:WD40 repeat protein